jgi:hypothetical protein
MYGQTAIMIAAIFGQTTTVKFLQAAGASIIENNSAGCSALIFAALHGRWELVQYFFQEAGAIMSDATSYSETVWDLLMHGVDDHYNDDSMALTSLLKVIVMLDDAPPDFVARLSSAHARLTARGLYFRAQLPSYLEQQRASVVKYCPLPVVLRSNVAAYATTTPEDMWADGLRI